MITEPNRVKEWNPTDHALESDPPETVEQAIKRLALLPPTDYDKVRQAEAKRLGLRVTTLDDEIANRRPTKAKPNAAGGAVVFEEPEAWPHPVSGAHVLDQVAAMVSRYVVLPKEAADAIALWIAHAHGFDAFTHTPRLNIKAPEKGCGKTLTLDVIQTLTPRAQRVENLTLAVLFRLVDAHKPTLLIDEYDTFLKENEELRGALNAGHKRGGGVLRCEGDNNEIRSFKTFAPVALAGIRALPSTLHDRSIVISLARAKPDEVRERFDSRKTEGAQILKRQLARWVTDNLAALEACEPTLPPQAFNRVADNWRPLFAIAELVGGDWLERVHRAFVALSAPDDDGESIGVLLLADIRTLFEARDTNRLSSAEMVEALAAKEERPWPEWSHGKPITVRQLASLLKPFGIKPHGIRIGDATPRGYDLAQFQEVFARYLTDHPDQSATPQQARNSSDQLDYRSATPISDVADRTSQKSAENGECCGVADVDAWEAEI